MVRPEGDSRGRAGAGGRKKDVLRACGPAPAPQEGSGRWEYTSTGNRENGGRVGRARGKSARRRETASGKASRTVPAPAPGGAPAPFPDDLPAPGALQDVPEFAVLRVDEAQRAAFDAYRAEVARATGSAAEELHLGCIVRLDRGFPLVITAEGAFRSEHAVSFARDPSVLPAVGDWVAVRNSAAQDRGVIERVLPRRTVFERWRGGKRGERQVLAANVDVILIVQALGAERGRDEAQRAVIRDRIARSMVLVNDCGAAPVVVLTKADRVDAGELEAARADVRRLVGPDVRTVVTSSAHGQGLEEVRSCIPAGSVAMILGESGVGKSTLINALLGHELMATGAVRARDDTGRHTTVARVMVALPAPCGVLIDAPGLRSLPLVGHERGLARTFPEVVEASRACKFNDCTHTHEPGCAVRAAVEEDLIEAVRADAFLALAREMRVSAQSLDPDICLP